MRTDTIKSRNEILIGCLLLLVLAVTRSGITQSHFGTAINLPDASWAMFLLAGYFIHSRWWLPAFMLACVAIDYFVIAGGVSDDCFTPAYPFLIPAYLSLWASGRWLQRHAQPLLLNAALAVLMGGSACFIISNVGSYLAAGYSTKMSAMAYATAVSRYWPYYLLHTCVYVGVGLLIAYVVRSRKALPDRAAKVD